MYLNIGHNTYACSIYGKNKNMDIYYVWIFFTIVYIYLKHKITKITLVKKQYENDGILSVKTLPFHSNKTLKYGAVTDLSALFPSTGIRNNRISWNMSVTEHITHI